MMSRQTQRRGRWGEDIAARYLAAHGYRILARNVRTPYGEIDLIAQQGDEIVFVEVKTRTTLAFGWPEEAVTARKLTHVARSALAWLAEHSEWEAAPWRVDVVAIRLLPGDQRLEVRHFEDVLTV